MIIPMKVFLLLTKVNFWPPICLDYGAQNGEWPVFFVTRVGGSFGAQENNSLLASQTSYTYNVLNFLPDPPFAQNSRTD